MADLFATGRIIDLILGLVVLEAVLLALWRGSTLLANLAANLVSGFCLMCALRAALTDAWWGWVALFLTGALVAHLADLRGRFRSR